MNNKYQILFNFKLNKNYLDHYTFLYQIACLNFWYIFIPDIPSNSSCPFLLQCLKSPSRLPSLQVPSNSICPSEQYFLQGPSDFPSSSRVYCSFCRLFEVVGVCALTRSSCCLSTNQKRREFMRRSRIRGSNFTVGLANSRRGAACCNLRNGTKSQTIFVTQHSRPEKLEKSRQKNS